MRRLLEKYIVT